MTTTTTTTTTEEGAHTVPDGTKLYTKTWKPANGPPRAILAFFHGFSDHCNAYYEFFPTLAAQGIEVRGVDMRGWGRSVTSPSDRGLTGPTSLVLADTHSFLLSLSPSTAPLFLMGHSMGGGQVLNYVLNPASPFNQPGTQKPELAGVLVHSPLIALHPSSRPSVVTVVLGRLAAKLLPRWNMRSELDPSLMCRDERVGADWVADELCHDTGTLEGLAGMLDRGLWLEGIANGEVTAPSLTVERAPPMWFGHGTDDMITSFEATKRFVEVLGARDKTFKVYDGAYHKVHAEPGDVKVRFARDVAEWILERCPLPAGQGSREDSKPKDEAKDAVEGEGSEEPVETKEEGSKAKL